jgi:hypothetical protein
MKRKLKYDDQQFHQQNKQSPLGVYWFDDIGLLHEYSPIFISIHQEVIVCFVGGIVDHHI